MNLKSIKHITVCLPIIFIFGCHTTQEHSIYDTTHLKTLEKRVDDLSKSVTLIIKDTNVMHNKIEMLAQSQDSLEKKIGKLEEGVTSISKKFFGSPSTDSCAHKHVHTPEEGNETEGACNGHAEHTHKSAADVGIHDDTIHAVTRNIAAGFWDALMANDLEAAKSFATKSSGANLKLNDSIDNSNNQATFGDIIINDNKATIETILNTQKDGSQISIPLQTILVKENYQWKVDADQTMMSVFGGAMGELMKDLGEAMKNGMEGMSKTLAEGMAKSMEEMAHDNENRGQETTSVKN